MTADAKRKLVVQGALSRKGKNTYTQHYEKRYLVDSGWGDCSSTLRHWFKKLLNIDIGLNTEAQIKSKLGKVVDLKITNGIPDESKMKIGDCLYFRGKNNNRYLGTGHVEMYIGNGQIFGHGSGKGGTVKNMKDYCTKRQNTKSTAKLKNTGLIAVVRFIEDDVFVLTKPSKDWVKRLQVTLNKLNYRDKNGNKLVEDGLAGKLTKSACISLKRGMRNEIVGLAQERLLELGFNPNGIDNSFGGGMEKAVIKMKKKVMGAKNPTGVLGNLSWDVLLGRYKK